MDLNAYAIIFVFIEYINLYKTMTISFGKYKYVESYLRLNQRGVLNFKYVDRQQTEKKEIKLYS